MHERQNNGEMNMSVEDVVCILSGQFPGIDEGYIGRIAKSPLAKKPEFYGNLTTILEADEEIDPIVAIQTALNWSNKLPSDPKEVLKIARIGRRYEEEMRLLNFDLSAGSITREQYQKMGQDISNKYHADQS